MEPKRDIENREDIELLISTFYHQATQDELIGFFFTDVAAIKLEEHLPTMYNFWENILFQTGNYHGGMMYKHILLHEKEPLRPQHFERWFALFEQTVDTNFAGPNAEEAKRRARTVIQTMPLKLRGGSLPLTWPRQVM
ncbi:MAG TPA: group III truncated hemoglobin [Ktedonobacteraceae bacterium]|jgi:hemoglobin|nr:group III truncated hemoglobin [Ktedonobacteraceae bacterium]